MKIKLKNLLKSIKKKGKKLKIVSNSKKGTIKVYNQNGKLMIKKTNLSKDNIETIEDHIISYITTNINQSEQNSNENSFDPMVT